MTYDEGNSRMMLYDSLTRSHMKSREKLSAEYLLIRKAYDHQTWQNSHL